MSNRRAKRPEREVVIARSFELRRPIMQRGKLSDTLEMREIEFGDLMDTDGLGDFATAAKLIELLGRVPRSSVRSMDPRDVAEISEWIGEQTGDIGDVGDVLDEDEDDDHP